MRFRSREKPVKSLEVSAMIDVVFLLLVFFMLTLNIAALEGVHEVEAAGRGPGQIVEIPELVVQLSADDDGSLAEVRLNGRLLGHGDDGVKLLQQEVTELCASLGSEASQRIQVSLQPDYRLKYGFTARVMGVCSTRKTSDGSLVPLGPGVRILTANVAKNQ